jgi:amino acid permease
VSQVYIVLCHLLSIPDNRLCAPALAQKNNQFPTNMSDWDPNYFQKDEERLQQLGYKQQLIRNLRPLHSFGIAFAGIVSLQRGLYNSYVSMLTATKSIQGIITTLFGYSYATGGPGTMTISWIVVSFFSCFVALSMAEIVSALPTSGGPYFWAAVLAPSKFSPLASWITAWSVWLIQNTLRGGCRGKAITLIFKIGSIFLVL